MGKKMRLRRKVFLAAAKSVERDGTKFCLYGHFCIGLVRHFGPHGCNQMQFEAHERHLLTVAGAHHVGELDTWNNASAERMSKFFHRAAERAR